MSLGEGKGLRAMIDDLDTQISTEIQAIEERLRQLYTVRIEVNAADDVEIAWGKQAGYWQLLVRDPKSDFMPLLNAPRHVRARALTGSWIQKLVDEAGCVLTKECEQRRAALSLAREFILPELDARIKSL